MKDSQSKITMKLIGHAVYAGVGMLYLFGGITEGLWTSQQYKQHFEKTQIERMQTLFGENESSSKDLEKAVQSYKAENQQF